MQAAVVWPRKPSKSRDLQEVINLKTWAIDIDGDMSSPADVAEKPGVALWFARTQNMEHGNVQCICSSVPFYIIVIRSVIIVGLFFGSEQSSIYAQSSLQHRSRKTIGVYA